MDQLLSAARLRYGHTYVQTKLAGLDTVEDRAAQAEQQARPQPLPPVQPSIPIFKYRLISSQHTGARV